MKVARASCHWRDHWSIRQRMWWDSCDSLRSRAGVGRLTAGLVLLLLAGCTDYKPVQWGGAVPWEQARKAIYRTSGAPVAQQTAQNGRHVVMPGETVSELAVRYRVPAGDLIALNSLKRPYHIHVGQVLRLPDGQRRPAPAGDGRTYVVARGDTLSGIAAAHGARLGDLVALNPGLDPARLSVGSRIRLPATAGGTQLASRSAQSAPAAVASRPAATSPAAAARTPAPAADPPAPAGDAEPAAPSITVAALPPPAAPAEAESAAAEPVAPPLVMPAPEERQAAERDAARQRDLAAVAAPALSGEGFLWPVTGGEVISGFGAKPDGRRNDGINIAAPAGSIVRAAENGLVVYADEDLAAFGRLLLIRHADGYLTAYAHNEALLVARGDEVRRGQPIAKVGRTGHVVEPQLHFEIRRGKGAVDPIALLGESEVRLARRD